MLLKILGAPISAPLAGFGFILRTIQDMAEHEMYDVDLIREDLMLLNAQLDDGEITEAEFEEREAVIMARLRTARAFREQQARK